MISKIILIITNMKKNHKNSPVSAATNGTNRLTKVYKADRRVVDEQTTIGSSGWEGATSFHLRRPCGLRGPRPNNYIIINNNYCTNWYPTTFDHNSYIVISIAKFNEPKWVILYWLINKYNYYIIIVVS